MWHSVCRSIIVEIMIILIQARLSTRLTDHPASSRGVDTSSEGSRGARYGSLGKGEHCQHCRQPHVLSAHLRKPPHRCNPLRGTATSLRDADTKFLPHAHSRGP